MLIQIGALWLCMRFRRSKIWKILLTHWGRVTHIGVGNLTTICSDNGLSPDQRQAIIWTNAGILSIGPLGINFSEISMEIQTFSFRKMRLKSSSAKWRPSCLGLNVLKTKYHVMTVYPSLNVNTNHSNWIAILEGIMFPIDITPGRTLPVLKLSCHT